MTTKFITVPDEVKAIGQWAVDRYLSWCDQNGGPPSGKFQSDLAIMYARQSACGTTGTDRAFQEGRGCGQAIVDMHPRLRKKLERNYRRLTGMSLPSDAQYISQGAKRPCDPTHVVQTVGDVKRLNEKIAAESRVDADRYGKILENKSKKLGGMLLKRRMQKELRDPSNIGKSIHEIKEKVVDKHGYSSSPDV